MSSHSETVKWFSLNGLLGSVYVPLSSSYCSCKGNFDNVKYGKATACTKDVISDNANIRVLIYAVASGE